MLKTLKIKEETHSRLLEYGMKGDSFDKIIKRLLYEHNEMYKHIYRNSNKK